MPPSPRRRGRIHIVADEFRAAVLRREDRATTELRAYYRMSSRRIEERLAVLVAHMEKTRTAGQPMSQAWAFQLDRWQALQAQIEREMTTFGRYAAGHITKEQRELITLAQAHAEALTRAGLGPSASLALEWAHLPREAIEQMAGYLHRGSPLADLLERLGPEVAEQARSALMTGMALGTNPRVVARQMMTAMGLGRNRAERIARTEMLRAYREATRQSYRANSDVVKGWLWSSSLDMRTCPACWAMHGTEHSLDEELDGHPNCRCAMVPLTKTWAELGFEGISETRAYLPAGEDVFAGLSRAQQERVLGPRGYGAYRAGDVTLADFVGRRFDPRWGTMRYARSAFSVLGRR